MASGYVQYGYLIILWKENLGYQALNSVQKVMQLTVDRIIRPQFERIQLPKQPVTSEICLPVTGNHDLRKA